MSALSSLFTTLNSQLDALHYADALRTCESILSLSPGDVDGLQIQLICLVKLDRLDAALRLLDQPIGDVGKKENTWGEKWPFERAYVLYRLRRFEESWESMWKVPKGERKEGWAHLEAQILYMSGKYGKALEAYERNFKNVGDDTELACNVVAACIGAGEPAKAKSVQCTGSSYELEYNYASALADEGKVVEGIDKILKAQELCERVLAKEGLSALDIEDETAFLRVQYAYMLQMLGQTAEALGIYSAIVAKKCFNFSLSVLRQSF